MKISFSIPGPPQGKGRPRHTKSGRTYTPLETVEAERDILRMFKLAHPRHKPFLGPVMVRVTAIFPIPAGFNAKQRAAAMAGEIFYTSKPDKDNIEKLLYDALNGHAWIDDSQCSGGCIKRYGHPPRLDVTIEELSNPVASGADIRREKKASQGQLVLGRPVKGWK